MAYHHHQHHHLQQAEMAAQFAGEQTTSSNHHHHHQHQHQNQHQHHQPNWLTSALLGASSGGVSSGNFLHLHSVDESAPPLSAIPSQTGELTHNDDGGKPEIGDNEVSGSSGGERVGEQHQHQQQQQQQQQQQNQQVNWQNAKFKAEILGHPLYEQLLSAHVACLRIATPVDQLPRIDAQLAQSQNVVTKYSALANAHSLVPDDKELDQFMVLFPLFFSIIYFIHSNAFYFYLNCFGVNYTNLSRNDAIAALPLTNRRWRKSRTEIPKRIFIEVGIIVFEIKRVTQRIVLELGRVRSAITAMFCRKQFSELRFKPFAATSVLFRVFWRLLDVVFIVVAETEAGRTDDFEVLFERK
ncbi:Homeobox protein knotted-1-like 3 [Bienertia sinuspersici]